MKTFNTAHPMNTVGTIGQGQTVGQFKFHKSTEEKELLARLKKSAKPFINKVIKLSKV